MTTVKNNIIPPATKKLVDTLPKRSQYIAKYLSLYEDDRYLAPVRFTQDTIVNWVPKAIFARSLADFSEMSFLELSENVLVYFGGSFLSKHIFQKLFLRKLSPELKGKVLTSATELIKNRSSETTKTLMPLKAALAVCGLVIPIAEYSLSYVKNLLTLKIFKEADFNNIANLNKDKQEDLEKQKKVKNSAIKHLKYAAGAFAGCLGFAVLLATKGKNSKLLQSISESILIPGNKVFKAKNNSEKSINEASRKASGFNKYFGLDSSKLCRGQLTTCVFAGFLGYMGAANDRGKQNMLEVLFRYPIVTFYVITGSELLEKAYTKILKKQNKCKEILDEKELSINKEVPKFIELKALAEKLSKKNGTPIESEFQKLFKQKTAIVGIPLAFSLVVMGIFVAAYSRFFTQYRYNREKKKVKSK